jgi:hypothetical protein
MTMLRKIRDVVAVCNLYVLAFCVLFLIQEYTIGQIPWVRNLTLLGKVYVHDIIFAISSIIIIAKYIRAYPPTHSTFLAGSPLPKGRGSSQQIDKR